jgi:hypothetical protein
MVYPPCFTFWRATPATKMAGKKLRQRELSIDDDFTTNPSACDARLFEQYDVEHAKHTVEARYRLLKDRIGYVATAY